jgi:hypothetical protein
MRRVSIIIVFLLLLTAGCDYLPESWTKGEKENQSPVAYIDSITPAKASAGDPVTFTGHGVDIDGTIVAFRWSSDLDGELSVKPSFEINSLSVGTHVISLKVQDNNGTWSDEVTRTISIVASSIPVPVITYFTASPLTIDTGQSSELKWEVSNATSINISPDIGIVDASGTRTVIPDTTTGYTLTASNSYGTVYTQVTITVSGPENLEGLQELILHSVSDEDGSLVKYSESYEKEDVPCAGDTSGNLPSKAFLSFDISAIPTNAVIEAAILDLSKYTISGEPTYVKGPHGNMGALEFYFYQYGNYDDLDRAAYMKIAPLIQNGSQQEYPLDPWQWDIKESSDGEPVLQELVQSDATRFQLRIQFFTSTNWDGVADMICFKNAMLTVYYYIP